MSQDFKSMPSDHPSLQLNITGSSEHKQKAKRGSSGLANLQKARMKKMLRRERMKRLVDQRASQKPQTEKETKQVKSEVDIQIADYFLGQRHKSPAEKLIIPLRFNSLLKRLHKGENLCKQPPVSLKDKNTFPTFNIIQQIEGFRDSNKNPLDWTVHETYNFIRHISPIRNVAKSFIAEEIDGEALINLTKSDLINHFNLDPVISDSLISVFLQLRREIIKRFINI